jgi:hypothetical protein
VVGQSGRKVNNALTLTFRASAEETIATAVQKGSAGVLFGFRNGGSGHYTITGEGGEIVVDCSPKRTTSSVDGIQIGWIEKGPEGDGTISRADGGVAVRIAGQPDAGRQDPTWSYGLSDADGTRLGTLTWLRTAATFDLGGEIADMIVWWDRAGQSLKVPSLGAHLALERPVDETVGDLLLAACVDVSLGSHSFVRAAARLF